MLWYFFCFDSQAIYPLSRCTESHQMDYNFSTLNDKEFELLCRDLLNLKLKLRLQSFKTGKDQGIDLRYSTARNSNAVIVQAKHYTGSTFAQLKHVFKTEEVKKVKKLKPNRYIITTSLSLSAAQKDDLKKLLKPYIRDQNDIFGKEDLNALLGEFEIVEKRYHKLWFSSAAVLSLLLNNAVEGRTKDFVERSKLRASLYVETRQLRDARKVLAKERILLITGQPGVGKSTMAEILVLEYFRQHKKVYFVEDVLEAETVFSPSPEDHQIFLFDDFLGENYYSIMTSGRDAGKIVHFIERIRNTPNKFLILTTRTVILGYAKENQEKISRLDLSQRRIEVKISSFSDYEKAQILYNHLYFRCTKTNHLKAILKNAFYNQIINHKNFTPRIIEFITEKSRTEALSEAEYVNFISRNLDTPEEIWKFSFSKQIRDVERIFLLTLFTFETPPTEGKLQKAFDARMRFEKTEHNITISVNQFLDSVKTLSDGFIYATFGKTWQDKTESRRYHFINPSLGDYIIAYIRESFSERKALISGIAFSEQLERFLPEKQVLPLEPELQEILLRKVQNRELETRTSTWATKDKNHHVSALLEILFKYCTEIDINDVAFRLMKEIDFSESSSWNYAKFLYIFSELGRAPAVIKLLSKKFQKIALTLIALIGTQEEAELLPEIFSNFDVSIEEFSEHHEDQVLDMIYNILCDKEELLKEENEDTIDDEDDVKELYNEINSLKHDLEKMLFGYPMSTGKFDPKISGSTWNSIIRKNSRDDNAYYTEFRTEFSSPFTHPSSKTESQTINDLFTMPPNFPIKK